MLTHYQSRFVSGPFMRWLRLAAWALLLAIAVMLALSLT